jgi:hypothetical protein
MEYVITAEYKVTKELVIDILDGQDPMDESKWGDIIGETDIDCQLYDVINAEVNA